MNIYEQVLANIDADPRAWCKDEWSLEGDDGKVVSRCLVEHIDLATGVSYIKPNGKRFVSKNPKRWTERNRVLAQLASLLPKRHQDHSGPNGYEVVKVKREQIDQALSWGDRSPFVTVYAESDLVNFNDDDGTTRTKIRNLLKRAAKRFPED